MSSINALLISNKDQYLDIAIHTFIFETFSENIVHALKFWPTKIHILIK